MSGTSAFMIARARHFRSILLGIKTLAGIIHIVDFHLYLVIRWILADKPI